MDRTRTNFKDNQPEANDDKIIVNEVNVIEIYPKVGTLQAMASCTFKHGPLEFYISNLGIHKQLPPKKGLRVSYPTKKSTKNNYLSICHPINKASGDAIEEAVLGEFMAMLSKQD